MSALQKSLPPENPLVLLLQAIIEEAHLLACEFCDLGSHFSQDIEGTLSTERMRRLQSFDMLGQRAIANVAMLRGLERGLSGEQTVLEELVANVPFQSIRERLMRRLRNEMESGNEVGSVAGPNDVVWL